MDQPTLAVSTTINSDDHGGQVVVVALLCLVAGVLLLLTRLVIRWPWRPLFGPDDWFCLAATLLSIVQTAILIDAVHSGFGKKGKNLSESSMKRVDKLIYASDILYVVALCLGKLSVAALLRRLSPSKVSTTLIAAILLYGLTSTLIIAIRTPFSQPWNLQQSSKSANIAHWAAVESLGISIETALIILPILLLWPLQISKRTKVSVALGFALRFPVIILAALRIASIAMMRWHDFSFTFVDAEILGQIEMHYNACAATIPCLRIFLKGWNTGFLGTNLEGMDREEYARHSHSLGKTRRSTRSPEMSSSVGTQRSFRQQQLAAAAAVFDSQSAGHSESNVSADRGRVFRAGSVDSQHAIMIHQTFKVDSERI